ncbi:MAG: hypothetical protein KJ558_10160 [Gammaproteobacteria bacterium]|nr:hypothetical protein [Gammaproteobacteria bacterium]MBU1655170.1 hypothetical protein [Gammaproteobacteria bacterium]MBU1959981.1 hypothetical protein [Gammaproteobacteria bacterium]
MIDAAGLRRYLVPHKKAAGFVLGGLLASYQCHEGKKPCVFEQPTRERVVQKHLEIGWGKKSATDRGITGF